MKVIIKPTVERELTQEQSPKVSIESISDDLTCEEVVNMFRGALIAYGYHEDVVNEYLLTEYNNFGNDKEPSNSHE